MLLTSTGFSHERIKPGQIILKPGYYFSIEETRSVLRQLDKGTLNQQEVEHLKKLNDIEKAEEALLIREVELEKRSAGLSEKEAQINGRLLEQSEKARRRDRPNFFDRVFNFVGKVAVAGVLLK